MFCENSAKITAFHTVWKVSKYGPEKKICFGLFLRSVSSLNPASESKGTHILLFIKGSDLCYDYIPSFNTKCIF